MSRGFGSTFGVGSTDAIATGYKSQGTGSRSYSAWFWINGIGGGSNGRILQKGGGGGTGAETIFLNASTTTLAYARHTTDPVNQASAFNITVATGAWHHVLITDDGLGTSVAYLDGVSVTRTGFTASSGTAQNNTDPFWIGNRSGDSARNWDGEIAAVTIWDGVLLTSGNAASLAAGADPTSIQSAAIVLQVPLYGTLSPEPDLIVANGATTITGTKAGTSDPSSTIRRTVPVASETRVAVQKTMPLAAERRATVARSSSVPSEGRGTVTLQRPLAGAWRATVKAAATLSVECLATLTRAASVASEAACAVARHPPLPSEWHGGLQCQVVLPIGAAAAVGRAALLASESRAAAGLLRPLAAAWRGSVRRSPSAALHWHAATGRPLAVPVDWRTWLQAGTSLASESRLLVHAAAELPVAWTGSRLSVAPSPLRIVRARRDPAVATATLRPIGAGRRIT